MCCERGVTCDRASLLRRTLSLPLRRKGASSSRAARARGRKKEGRKEGRNERKTEERKEIKKEGGKRDGREWSEAKEGNYIFVL